MNIFTLNKKFSTPTVFVQKYLHDCPFSKVKHGETAEINYLFALSFFFPLPQEVAKGVQKLTSEPATLWLFPTTVRINKFE